MDLISRFNNLKLRAIKGAVIYKKSEEQIMELKEQYNEYTKKLSDFKESLVIQESTISLLKEVINKVSQESINQLVDIVTYALQTIFYDRKYSLEISISDRKNNKTVDFYLVEEKDDLIVRSPFNDAIGGGVISVVGFVLQVYYIGVIKQSNIMFCDESFTQLSVEYIPNLIDFMHQLSVQKSFIFVLISHDDRLIDYADRIYRVDKGEVNLS